MLFLAGNWLLVNTSFYYASQYYIRAQMTEHKEEKFHLHNTIVIQLSWDGNVFKAETALTPWKTKNLICKHCKVHCRKYTPILVTIHRQILPVLPEMVRVRLKVPALKSTIFALHIKYIFYAIFKESSLH